MACVSFLRGAMLILKDNDALLPTNFQSLVLKIFQHTTCATFKSFVDALDNNIDMGVSNLTVEAMFQTFEKRYTNMIGHLEWTPKKN